MKRIAIGFAALVVVLSTLAIALSAGISCSEEGATETMTISKLDLSEYTIYEPEERIFDPAAQSSEYVFLVAGKEAVSVEGPEIEGAAYFVLENEEIRKVDYGYFEDDWTAGFEVIVNSHLIYTIAIEDFEGEFDLAEVELDLRDNTIESTFIFAASPSGDGVAHDINITALIDGEGVTSKKARAIEVRASRGAEIQVSLRRISNWKEIELDPGDLDQIAFTDFAFVINLNSPVKTADQENMGVVYRALRKEWANTTVKVYAQEGTLADAMADFFFPEDDPANEVLLESDPGGMLSFFDTVNIGQISPGEKTLVIEIRDSTGKVVCSYSSVVIPA